MTKLLKTLTLDFFPNEGNWQLGNWPIASDTVIAIIKAQGQNFPWGF